MGSNQKKMGIRQKCCEGEGKKGKVPGVFLKKKKGKKEKLNR